MLIQFYGQFGGQNSNAIVSRGLACALKRGGLDVQIYDPEGVYNGLWEDIPTGISPSADIGIFIGYPPHSIQFLMGHETKVGCFIAESSSLPAEWSAIAASCDLVCVPSTWNAVAFIQGGVSPKKLMVVPHGLSPVWAKAVRREPRSGAFSFLHIAGAAGFRERKGTLQLIKAFGQLGRELNNDLSLMMRCGMTDPALLSAIKRTEVPDLFVLTEDANLLEPRAMREFLCQDWDALVLPSRAEAFGLCALEARSVGLPVILTHCTGHSQHGEDFDTVIEHGPERPCQVNGIPGGTAPSVKASAIYDALLEFIQSRNSRWVWAQHGANNYYDKNSWTKVTRQLTRWLRSHKKMISRPGIGI